MPKANAPIAYLTCEVKGRDLESRLLIASHLVKAGYPVIVGQQWGIFINVMGAPKGCILFKTANITQSEWMAKWREQGHVIAASDEECFPAGTVDYPRTIHPTAAVNCHRFFAINDTHAKVLSAAYPAFSGKIEATGTARVDILRAAKTAPPLAHDYVLVNTSFGIRNSNWGDINAAVNAWANNAGFANDPKAEVMVRDRLDFEAQALRELLAFIDWLVANVDLPVVVRPHPAERPQTWLERYQANPRITVVPRSEAAPWIQHARLIVHCESTTGVEAAIAGTPALNLSPPLAWRDRLIVSQVNVTVPSAEEAKPLITSYLADGAWPAPAIDARTMFPSGGADRTARAIARLLPKPGPLGPITWTKINRTDIQRSKFTVSLEEVRKHVTCKVQQLDDSLFFLTP